jgi:hypothetical protein
MGIQPEGKSARMLVLVGPREWLLHILRAPLMVKQEAEYAAEGGGLAPIARDAEAGAYSRRLTLLSAT